MNRLRHPIVLACCVGLLAIGCSKKKAETAEETPADAAPAATGPAAPPVDLRPLSPTVPKEEKAAPHPELAASDGDYVAWFKKYHLDLNDPNMLDADPDGDGFTNREEFLAGTDPLDPNSHPGVKQTMKMKEYTRVDLPFVLRAVDGETAQIETAEAGEKKVETVRAGQTLRNSQYKVAKVQSNPTFDKDGHPVDASHVVLEHANNHHTVDLVKDLPTRSSETYAVLTSNDGKQTITVHQGDTFSWPGEPNVNYTVKDLRDEQVILQQVETGQMWTVRKQ